MFRHSNRNVWGQREGKQMRLGKRILAEQLREAPFPCFMGIAFTLIGLHLEAVGNYTAFGSSHTWLSKNILARRKTDKTR